MRVVDTTEVIKIDRAAADMFNLGYVPDTIKERLSPQQDRIYQLLLQGLTPRETAAELGLSIGQVNGLKKVIIRKGWELK